MHAAGSRYVPVLLTLAAQLEIDHICDTDIDDAQEALIPLLELLLIKDLHCNDRRVGDSAAGGRGKRGRYRQYRYECIYGGRGPSSLGTHMSKESFQYGFRVFLMTLIQALFKDMAGQHKDVHLFSQAARRTHEVVCVCSPSTVTMAKGSGNRKTSRFAKPSAATMLMRTLRES